MEDLTLALTSVEGFEKDSGEEPDGDKVNCDQSADQKAREQSKSQGHKARGLNEKIGAGSGKGLSAKQRNQALFVLLPSNFSCSPLRNLIGVWGLQSQTEAARLPQIQSHPAFKASPWETIRLHAQNSVQMKRKVAEGWMD